MHQDLFVDPCFCGKTYLLLREDDRGVLFITELSKEFSEVNGSDYCAKEEVSDNNTMKGVTCSYGR